MDLTKTLVTTVVGSYPVEPSKSSLQDSHIYKKDPFLESLEKAVESQLDCGVELISDGQTRGNMIEIFAKGLRGYRLKEKVEIVSEIGYTGSITVDDAKKVKALVPDDIGIKGILTGPFTLVKSSQNQHYSSEKEAVLDTSEAMHKEGERLAELCDVVQLDEPFFSNGFPEYGKEMVERVLDLDTTTALHVCGDVGPIADRLVEINVDILDHEFASNEGLYDVYSDIYMDMDQRLAVGVVTTDSEVEKVEKIKKRIERAHEHFGPKTMLDPDCGLRNLDEDTAYKKLENMVEARDVFLDERS